jgi:hypothetical protein
MDIDVAGNGNGGATVYHGRRIDRDVLQAVLPSLTAPVTSGGDDNNGGGGGGVDFDDGVRVCVCGPPPFNAAVCAALAQLGFPEHTFHAFQ